MSKAQKAETKAAALGKKIVAQQRALQAGKEAYKRADELLQELIGLLKVGEPVPLPDGSVGLLVDKFATKNRIGAGLGVNRYEIEVSRSADVTAKL